MNKQKIQKLLDEVTEALNDDAILDTEEVIIELLEALLDEPKAVDEPVKPVKWRVEIDEDYYYIDDLGEIESENEQNERWDNYRYLTGNYYKTEQEAEEALKVTKAKGRLNHAYYALVGDWKPDYGTGYSFLYNPVEKEWIHWELSGIQPLETFVFPNTELKDQFIKENEADLKLVFNINDNE